MGDKLDRLGIGQSLCEVHTHYLRDDLSTFLHQKTVVLMDVKGADEIFVVKCCPSDGCSCQQHRLHVSHRSYGARSPHLVRDAKQAGDSLLCFKLECDGPSWTLGSETQGALLSHAVHLEYDAVGGYRERFSCRVPVVDEMIYPL